MLTGRLALLLRHWLPGGTPTPSSFVSRGDGLALAVPADVHSRTQCRLPLINARLPLSLSSPSADHPVAPEDLQPVFPVVTPVLSL